MINKQDNKQNDRCWKVTTCMVTEDAKVEVNDTPDALSLDGWTSK